MPWSRSETKGGGGQKKACFQGFYVKELLHSSICSDFMGAVVVGIYEEEVSAWPKHARQVEVTLGSAS